MTKDQETNLANYIRQCEERKTDALFFNKQLDICMVDKTCSVKTGEFAAIGFALMVLGFYIGSELKR